MPPGFPPFTFEPFYGTLYLGVRALFVVENPKRPENHMADTMIKIEKGGKPCEQRLSRQVRTSMKLGIINCMLIS